MLVLNLAAVAACGPLSAEPLSDLLAGPASRALKMGPWASKPVAHRSSLNSWRPTISVALAIPKKAAAAAKPKDASQPYGLHGPALEKDRSPLTGIASYYGTGEKTATGERFDPSDMTAAHRTLPFGTRVKVTRVDTGDSVVVRINDRGPFKPGRVIDLSKGAAQSLGMMDVGLTNVRLEVVN